MTGRSPIGSGHSAEPEPCSAVSAETASVPNALFDALGWIVSMIADARDTYPDDKTTLEAVTEAVNELYACVADGVFGAVATECEKMVAQDDGWSEWIHPLPGYRMQCCDCGLVHEMETAIVQSHEDARATADGEDAEHVIVFRMRRFALAAGARSDETTQLAQSEGRQSGGEAVTPIPCIPSHKGEEG